MCVEVASFLPMKYPANAPADQAATFWLIRVLSEADLFTLIPYGKNARKAPLPATADSTGARH
jgi:hypothetical protein